MEDGDAENKCGVRFINEIKMKSKYLFHAFSMLFDRKDTERLTQENICGIAIKKVKDFDGAKLVEHDDKNNNNDLYLPLGQRKDHYEMVQAVKR